ncbi:MAG: molybdopterin-dependent oxidoreductase [Betaproteobacteria bacterium]|nr:molybdopterin-dependent oxidoreductase [Betaproteobacteria bacterium]
MENTKMPARRTFLKGSAAVGGGLALGFYLPAATKVAQAEAMTHSPNAWVKIGTDNSITLMCARSEMGQDVYTSLAMLIAEELEVDVNKVRVEFAPPAEVYINSLLGGQLTGGSTSVRDAWEKLRKAGASARMMLTAAAAQKWGVDAGQCKASGGMVMGPGGKRATYGSLAEDAAKMEVPKDVPLKPVTEFKQVGSKAQKRLDTPLKVAGQGIFGIDTRVPGMLYASVKMPPMIGGKVKSYDDSRAKNMPGVKAVVQYSRGVAVVADSFWQAKKARDLLDVEWDAGPNGDNDMAKVWKGLEDAAAQPGAVFRELGDADTALPTSAKVYKATYKLPFLSHSPMEPMNTVADVRSDGATIITPTQFQQLVPFVVAGATGLKPEQINVITTFLGGGFGRRVEVDYTIDAAEISKAVGAPVKMVWTREDDMTHDSYRPGGIYTVVMGVDGDGKPVAYKYHGTSPSISARLFPSIVKDGIDPFAVEAIDNYPYNVPNHKLTYQMYDAGITPGYWRGVSHNLNCYVVEGFIDEVAAAVGKDPIQYRIDNLEYTGEKHKWSGLSAGVPVGGRMKVVLEEVRAKSGWGKKLPDGQGMGVAVMEGYNTVMSAVAQVSVTKNYDVIVDKVTYVVDAGQVIHPDQANAQIESCTVFGMSACLWGEITVKNGGVQQDNFDQYRVVRMNEAPKSIDIHWIKPAKDQPPGGLGEPATAVVQAAIGNAIFAATGIRVREMPFTPENIKGAMSA